MNLLGYSGFAVGNHDFDWSADTLMRRVAEMRFSAFAANMVERRTGRMPRWARSDTLLVRRGVRVGLFGLAYVETPRVTLATNVANLRFEDDSTTAARLVPALRRRWHPQLVIELGHTPAETDSTRRASGDLARLARGVRGVDLWLGGHSHNYVLDEIGGATVMIPGSQGQALGVCDLTVDPVAGRVVERRARILSTYADEVTPDSLLAARVAGWNSRVAALAATPIGRNARTLTRGRGGESTLGDLVADAMRAETKADLAFTNSGGLRADLPEGTITKGSVYEVIPFDNTLVVVKLTGAQVRGLLEDGLRHGRVSQQSGLRYRFDLSRPAGQRLLSVALADGSALDEARTYLVVVNNFMAAGGDNYDALARVKDQLDTGALARDALEHRIAELTKDGPLDLRADGRIEREGGSE
jgi:5'-nucleotidase / UDP-sugar diphosphatase